MAAFLWAQFEEATAITTQRLLLWERYHEAFADLEAMIAPVHAGFPESEGFDEESFFLGDFSHGKKRSVEATNGFSLPDFVRGPALASLVGIFNHLEFQTCRMLEVNERLSEALVDFVSTASGPVDLEPAGVDSRPVPTSPPVDPSSA